MKSVWIHFQQYISFKMNNLKCGGININFWTSLWHSKVQDL